MAEVDHPLARVALPVAGVVGVVGYGALYLAALAFYGPFGSVPEDAGLTQTVLLVRLVLLLSVLVVLALLALAVLALLVAAVDVVRRLLGRPRWDLRRRPGRRVVVVGGALVAAVLGSAPGDGAEGWLAAAVLLVAVLAATWVTARIAGGTRAPAAVLLLAVWASAAFGLVSLCAEQSESIRADGSWDDGVNLVGIYPGYAYVGEAYREGAAPGASEPFVNLGDSGGVFVLFSCADARTVRVSTAAVSVTLVPQDAAQVDAARDRCTALLAGR